MDAEVFTALLDLDPTTLLQSGIARPEQKELLVEALLGAVEAGELNFSWHLDFRHFNRLDHPGLDNQLAPLLRDPERAHGARLTAIRLAGRCKRPELAQDLLRLALDKTEKNDLRVGAVDALARIEDTEALHRLRSLLPGDGATEEEHQLGAGLVGALWPDALSSEELFEMLRRSEESDCLRKYSSFLYDTRELALLSKITQG
jgi:hypothetical protein